MMHKWFSILILAALVGASSCASATTIGEAKIAGPGWSGDLQGFVTRQFPDYNCFVIEESNRSAAITVTPITIPMDEGNEVAVEGSIESDGIFHATRTQTTGYSSTVPALGLSNRSVAGTVGDPGLSVMDMLVTTWGKVLDYRTAFPDGSIRFHITDGFAKSSPTVGVPGGAVSADAIQIAIPPSVADAYPVIPGNMVTVKGIAGKGMTTTGSLRSVMIGVGDDLSRLPLPGELLENGVYPPVRAALDGTGDFGRETPGTTTDGIQEAINAAVSSGRSLYIEGLPIGAYPHPDNAYHIKTPISIPAARRFKIEGGNAVLNWEGSRVPDMLTIDSAKDCHYVLGLLVYVGDGTAVKVKPTNTIPGDTSPAAFTDSDLRLECSVDATLWNASTKTAVGLGFDTTNGPITNSQFYVMTITNMLTCIKMPDTGAAFAYNLFEIIDLHTNGNNTILIRVGAQSSQNKLRVIAMGVDFGATNVKGIDVFGSNNTIDVTSRGGFAPASEVILEPSASGNQINYLQTLSDPFSLITDLATNPTNEVTWVGSNVAAYNATVSGSPFHYTQKLSPAVVRVASGTVSSVILTRGTGTVNYGAAPGDILMSPGDGLTVTYSSTPTVQVIPMKTR